jgi:hypothetical protein
MIAPPPRTKVESNAVANGWRLLLRAVRDRRPVFALRSLALLTLGLAGAPVAFLFFIFAGTVGVAASLTVGLIDGVLEVMRRYGDSVGYAAFMKLRLSSERFAAWAGRQVAYDHERDCRVWRPLVEDEGAEGEGR